MPRIEQVSGRAIQIDFQDISAIRLSALARALSSHLHKLRWPLFQIIQSDQALSVLFQKPLVGDFSIQAAISKLSVLLPALVKTVSQADREASHHKLVVNYGGTAGQDLEWLAAETGLTTARVIELHSRATYTVEFLGFLPGFAYLSGLPEALQLPRRSSPRARVPAGTLAVGAGYCAVYPWESPGGWHLLGHVERVLFDPDSSDEQGRCFFHAGDTVQFIQGEHA